MPSTDQILHQAAETFRERNAVYKDNWKDIGPVMAGFFPNGLNLKTPEDFIRFHLFMLAIIKYTRFTNNWKDGHQDSLRDAAVYTAMLESFDSQALSATPVASVRINGKTIAEMVDTARTVESLDHNTDPTPPDW